MPSNKNPGIRVIVQDSEGKFLLPTSAALARKLLRSDAAKVQSKNPFSISLNKTVESQNTERKMRSTNLHEFFKEPKSLYVQNVTTPIGNVSLEFRELSGQITPVSIPSTRNPVILTDYVTFDVVKASAEFFKYLRPTATSGAKLQLLTEDEFNSYYAQRAKELAVPSVQDAIAESQQKVDQLMQKPHIVSETEARAPREGNTTLPPEVNPRVISTCQQLDPSNSSKISAGEALEEFKNLELATIDYNYIVTNCFSLVEGGKGNDLVRKWAVNKMQSASAGDDIIQTSDEPKAKRTRLKQANNA